jgi:hypothetical protein
MAKENSRAITERMAITQRTIIKATPLEPGRNFFKLSSLLSGFTFEFKLQTSNLKPQTSNL